MKKQWKWVIGGVAFCILAPVVSFMFSVGVRGYAMKSGAATVASFLGDLRRHDYVAARLMMAPSEQAAISVAALQRGQELIEKKKGQWLSPAEPNEFQPRDPLHDLWYLDTVELDKSDEMYISVRVVRTDTGWRVLEYHYDDNPA